MPLSTGALPSIVSSVVSGYRVQTPVSPYSHDFIVAYTQVLLTQPEASTVYEHPISSTPQPRSAWSLLDTVAQNTDGNHHMARNFLHPRHASLGGQMTSLPRTTFRTITNLVRSSVMDFSILPVRIVFLYLCT